MRKDWDWAGFFEMTRDDPPSELLIDAVKRVPPGGVALDMGAGALRNSRFLLSKGFHVWAFDSSRCILPIAKTIQDPRFKCELTSFQSFKFPKQRFKLAVAVNTLHFCPPSMFAGLFSKIKASLLPGGLLVSTVYGERDGYNRGSKGQTYPSRRRLESLLGDMDILRIWEEEHEAPSLCNPCKNWHFIHLMAQKNGPSLRSAYLQQ